MIDDLVRSMRDGAALVFSSWADALRADPELTVWEWANANRRLSSKASAEAGEYDVARVPYTREIQEVLSPSSRVQRVAVMKGAQLGFSEVANNFLGYIMDQAPGPTLLVLPTLELAQRYSKQRLGPMIAESKRLAARVRAAREKDSGNSTLVKDFPGGFLIMAGSNSAAGLRSMPARNLIGDDLDAWAPEAGEEGDSQALAERATLTFGVRRKIFYISTPTFEGRSRIAKQFETTDQRFYGLPCPKCGDVSPIAFSPATRIVVGARKFLEFDRDAKDKPDPTSARLHCTSCDARIEEHAKTEMLAAGEWIPTFPERSETERGYQISSLYSPLGWTSWAEIVSLWSSSKGNDSKLRVVVNQRFGEPWRERGEAPEWKKLYRQRERYPMGVVPRRALLLTAGIDVQGDRLEIEVRAWGEAEGGGLESWSIEYRVIAGGPEDQETWRDLERILATPYPHESGAELQITRAAIDTGFAATLVYQWARRQNRRRVTCVKGREGSSVVLSTPKRVDVAGKSGKTIRRGVELWMVGVDEAKATLYSWLRLEPPLDPATEPYPPGFMHQPEYGEEYFRQLCAEQLISRQVHGLRRYVWEKTLHDRNEVLDCNVYALVAMMLEGAHRWTPERWRELRDSLGSVGPSRSGGARRTRESYPVAPAPPASAPKGGAPRTGGYLGGRGKGWLRR